MYAVNELINSCFTQMLLIIKTEPASKMATAITSHNMPKRLMTKQINRCVWARPIVTLQCGHGLTITYKIVLQFVL